MGQSRGSWIVPVAQSRMVRQGCKDSIRETEKHCYRLPDFDINKMFLIECFLTSQNSPHILQRLKSNYLNTKSIKWSLRTY